MEMSCCPSHGSDPTFNLIGNKKMTWDVFKPMALFYGWMEDFELEDVVIRFFTTYGTSFDGALVES